jgi:hypothetical protein
MEVMASNFDQNLFAVQENLQSVLVCKHVPRKVTESMREILDRPFTAEEVEKALFQMGPCKAPRPDGFTTALFRSIR